MDTLPSELLFKIMLYLPLEDRLTCSLTCRRLAEAMSSSELLYDVWLDISGHEIEAARSVLIKTQRQYTNLVLYQANLSEFDSEFWRKVGANLRVLELDHCRWSSHVFYAILQQCSKLESLKFGPTHNESSLLSPILTVPPTASKYGNLSIHDFVLPEGIRHEELRDSLTHLLHLHLEVGFTAEVLDLLLGLMSNVRSIFLSSSSVSDSDFLERLPSILEKNRIIRTGASYGITSFEDPKKLVEITSDTLEELQLFGYQEHLSRSACDAIVNCTRLRRLTFHGYTYPISLSAGDLKKLVSNCPDLETLDLRGLVPKDEDMIHLFELKKLRNLSLGSMYGSRITNEFLGSLWKISTLVKLNLKSLASNSVKMRSLGRLTNLRTLLLYGVDRECFGAICENLESLTKLDLGGVGGLTDADGMKLCRFKELRSLRFRHGYKLTDLTFERGVGSRAMKSLIIGDCPITDAGLASIASHHDRLETLHLCDCENITDAGVVALLQNESRLKYLYMERCSSMQYNWIPLNICPRLRQIELY